MPNFAKTRGGRSAIQKLLNGRKLIGSDLASMGEIRGTLRISRPIDLRKCKSVNHALGSARSSPCLSNASLVEVGKCENLGGGLLIFPARFVLTSIEVFSITYGTLFCARTPHLQAKVHRECTKNWLRFARVGCGVAPKRFAGNFKPGSSAVPPVTQG